MKTQDGKYNEDKAKKVYEDLKNKLNGPELGIIADLIAIDGFVMIKTLELLQKDFETQVNA